MVWALALVGAGAVTLGIVNRRRPTAQQ